MLGKKGNVEKNVYKKGERKRTNIREVYQERDKKEKDRMDGGKERRAGKKGVRRGGGSRKRWEGKEWKMRDEDGSGASDIIAEAAVATCLSRIFEMGTECESVVLV